MTVAEADTLKQHCDVLRKVEAEIASADAYVQHS